MIWGWIVGVRFPKLQADPHHALLKKHMDGHFKSLFAFEGLIECGWDLGIQASFHINRSQYMFPIVPSPRCIFPLRICSSPSADARCRPSQSCEDKELASHTRRCSLPIQDQPYTPNYGPIHPLSRGPFFHPFHSSPHQRAGRPAERPHCKLFLCACLCRFVFFSPTSCTNMGLHAEFLGEIQSTLECPRGLHSKAELCGRVWEEKCNDLHLNGSTLANTMGLSFTGLGPPLYSKGPAGIER